MYGVMLHTYPGELIDAALILSKYVNHSIFHFFFFSALFHSPTAIQRVIPNSSPKPTAPTQHLVTVALPQNFSSEILYRTDSSQRSKIR